MSTAKEGGATANITSSSYGGAGAGGKFPRKPSRRSTKPYDRPPTALRVNDCKSSWLRKLVVEPASKLISYGADRFLAPLLRKRLPPLPPPQQPEAEADVSDGVKGTVREIQGGVQEHPCDCNQPMNISNSNGISELEQLLKQRTFTRSEVVHLRELLQSKAVEVSLEDVKNEDTASDYARHQQFASGLLKENRNGGNRSASMSTPIVNSKVLEDDNASPAELAKAYMGSRPSKVSPSVLGMRRQVGGEDTGLLSSFPSASASPIMALTKETPSILAAPDNGFITPRSRGRSAIYSMARTPYSKFHLSSNLKSFKRRSTVLDDEHGFEGSLRRTRQKSNLLASGMQYSTNHGVVIGCHAKQKLPFVGEQIHKITNDVGENENESVPSSSYAQVPSKSSKVASKILQHLEKLTPKELSESKLVARREKSSLTLTPSMLSGRALRSSMDDVNSSNKLLWDVHDDHKLGDRSNATLANALDFSMQKREKVKENGPKEIVVSSYKWNHVENNYSVESLKSSTRIASATDSNVKTGVSQPQKKRAFRMTAQEDYFELDGDAHCNGVAPIPFSEKIGPMDATLTDSKVAPHEEPKLERPSIQSSDKSCLALISKTSELNSAAAALGEDNVFSPASEEGTSASESAVLPLSVAESDKLKEANNHSFSSNSKVVENVVSLPSESNKEAELKIESSSSCLVNVPASAVSEVKIPESDKSPHPNHFMAGDVNGNFDFVPSAISNGPPIISSPLSVLFPAASNGANQISKGSIALPITFSTSSVNSAPTSTLATSSGSIFGLTANPSSSAGLAFKFGAAVDSSTSVSEASTTSVSVASDLGESTKMGTSSGSPLYNVSAFLAASSETNTLGLGGSSVSFSAPNKLQSPLFGSGTGTGLQGISTQSSLPSSTINSSTSLGSPSISQVVNPSNAFGFSSAVNGPPSTAVKFGSSLTEGNAAVDSSSSATTPGGTSVSFGLGSSSSCSTSVIGSSTAPLFSFAANSSGSAPVTNTAASSISGGASAVFTFAGNSSASSSAPRSTVFGSSWQSPTFGSSTFTSPSPSTGFVFSSSGPAFSFTTASPSVLSSPSFTQQQPVFGNTTSTVISSGFGAVASSPDQMNAEDSMAEDTIPQTSAAAAAPAPAVPIFGQPSSNPPVSFAFGSKPFMFGGQQNQVASQNMSPFQASGSLGFNAGGSFSLGSGGGDKSGRKMVRISKSKNRKK